jgi:hypothetical protein
MDIFTNIYLTFKVIWDWSLARLKERNTYDGFLFIIAGAVGLLFAPLLKYTATACVVYGLYRVLTKEHTYESTPD